uniref:Uncharacterized protein n=1 Tax=Lepeophtheirus salmonis TaxID=72036 RepID=A0A0K2SWI2_LEPSM
MVSPLGLDCIISHPILSDIIIRPARSRVACPCSCFVFTQIDKHTFSSRFEIHFLLEQINF